MTEIEQTLDHLEGRVGPQMSLGQRELVLVRLRNLEHSRPETRARADQIAASVRAIDDAEFGALREKLRNGDFTPDDFRTRAQTIPQYDLDGWTRRLFGLHEVPESSVDLTSDMVGYVTTHTIQVMEMASELGPKDIFYVLGSGLGFVPIFLSWLTGARAIGVEIEPNFVRIAQARAEELGLSDKVTFIEGDLREQDYDGATAFFMFYPCRDEMLAAVIKKMKSACKGRHVKVYSLGLSSPALAAEKWLTVRGQSPSALVALETK